MGKIKYISGDTPDALEQKIKEDGDINDKDIILYSYDDKNYIYIVNSNKENISYLSFSNNANTRINQLYNYANGEPNRSSYWQIPNDDKRYVNRGMRFNINDVFNNVTSNNGVNISNFSKWLQGSNHNSNIHVHNFSYNAYWNTSNAG